LLLLGGDRGVGLAQRARGGSQCGGLLCQFGIELVAACGGGGLPLVQGLQLLVQVAQLLLRRGLFGLALLVRRASARGAGLGIITGLFITIWGSLSFLGVNLSRWPWLRFPWDTMMVGVVATVAVILVGWMASLFFKPGQAKPSVLWDVYFKKGALDKNSERG